MVIQTYFDSNIIFLPSTRQTTIRFGGDRVEALVEVSGSKFHCGSQLRERSMTNDKSRSSVCRARKQLSLRNPNGPIFVPHLQTDPADSGNTLKERRYRGHFPFPRPQHAKSQGTIIPLARIQTSPSHAARLEPERRSQRRRRASSTTLCGAGRASRRSAESCRPAFQKRKRTRGQDGIRTGPARQTHTTAKPTVLDRQRCDSSSASLSRPDGAKEAGMTPAKRVR